MPLKSVYTNRGAKSGIVWGCFGDWYGLQDIYFPIPLFVDIE